MSKHATIPAYGELQGTALTGSYQIVISPDDDVLILFIFNSCNQPIIVSLDNGVTDQLKLDAECLTIDLRASSRSLGKPIVKAKHAGVVPTSGSLRVTVMK